MTSAAPSNHTDSEHVIGLALKKKPKTLLTYGPGTYRVTYRDPYQSIDLIEYYKSCIGQNMLGRGRQTRECAKIIFQHFISI
jgi:hypothetical protein